MTTFKFAIPERELTVNGQTIKVRGMTFGETKRFREAYKSDRESSVPLVASMCTLSPSMSQQEAEDAPTSVLMAINEAVFELSGMKKSAADAAAEGGDEKKD